MARKRSKARRRNGNPKLGVMYLRVSTEDQSIGPDAQRHTIREWCKARKITLVEEDYLDKISGATPAPKRPALIKAFASIVTHGAGALIVAKRDRLSRDIEGARQIETLLTSYGARVLSADGVGNDDTATGELTKGVFDLFAEHERKLISERTKMALAVKKAKGELTGRAPYGFKACRDSRDKNRPAWLEPDAHEQEGLAHLQKLAAQEMSLRDIAEEMVMEGYTQRNGKPWQPKTIARILDRLEADQASD